MRTCCGTGRSCWTPVAGRYLSGSPLSWALKELQELRKVQRGLEGARRRVTKRLGHVREVGWDAARRMRGLLTWHPGPQLPGALVPEERTASPRTRAGQLGEWQRLLTALQENRTELAHLEMQREHLETLLLQAEDLLHSQAALTAGKEETTQQLTELVSEGQRLATVLRFSLKQHYGPAAEKLADFGIQPFRGRKRTAPAE